MKHHVIFLGAGASYNSGYPVGEKLRLRLCSIEHYRSQLEETRLTGSDTAVRDFRGRYLEYFREFESVIDLFRYGGFATVDEFSRLASSKYSQQAQEMKKLMRLAFSFHNPEDRFHDSEYYGFLQRLFEANLYSLREDVTVISYNYDCYLDFLLMRAFGHRKRLSAGKTDELTALEANVLTSGFDSPFDLEWAKPEGFKYLKLHGSILFPREGDFKRMFDPNKFVELPPTPHGWKGTQIPPVIFPWEFFDNSGNVISENDFVFVREARDTKEKKNGQGLFNLYKWIWQLARVQVQKATKISFVGLSLHRYMEDGLKYLFNKKPGGPLQVVVANPTDTENLCRRLGRVLRRIAPDMEARGSWLDDAANQADNFGVRKYQAYGMTQRRDFREFIEREME